MERKALHAVVSVGNRAIRRSDSANSGKEPVMA